MIRKASAELAWFKSSYSSGTNGESCVEIAIAPDTATIHVRDSKHTHGARLALSPATWSGFVSGVPELERAGH
ncbi:DUF397 domain-containing protein [Streptomyces lomondensis]|uniref:DUF397 domain-containing protein n=1 Tax=Streptomyces lomondensis TaxID=68229 RepID=A0ABQ2X1A6_9ACTN|nr:DUF397 domain-containing protein [Streptomyces lomondensis]MCF0081783.1 DUF397 domain-containing protein [Streptomyces lomondensis]GGW91146.1 DUF397 domain-containing protein [Streptomyces lomondensis]